MARALPTRGRSQVRGQFQSRPRRTITALVPTLRGIVVTIIMLALCVGAVATRPSALILLIPALGLPLVVAPFLVLWRARRARAAELQPMVSPPLVPTGGSSDLRIQLTNTSDVALPPVSLDRPSDGWMDSPSAAQRAAARPWLRWDPVDPHHTKLSLLPLPTQNRGVFTIGPLRLWVHDPFGLVGMIVGTAAPVTLAVHPPVSFGTAPRSPRTPSEGVGQRHESSSFANGDDPAGEWKGLRPYAPGDRLHLLSWQAEARHGALLVHDFRPDTEEAVTFVLDDRAAVHRRGAFEDALSLLHGLVAGTEGYGAEFEIVTLSGRRVSGSTTPDGMVEFLTFLADALPTRAAPITGPGTALAGASVVITTETAVPTLPPLPGDPSVVVAR
jgi:uncharacterized protein (DUF58 family)